MENITIDIGDTVLCDYCDKDYTNSNETGGILIGSYATCPSCVPRMMTKLIEYNEMHYIKAECPKNMPFADWVRNYLR